MSAKPEKSVADVLQMLQSEVSQRVKPDYTKAGVDYPPRQGMTLIALKAEKRLEVWAKEEHSWHFIRSYPILAASGVAGPKLKQGDCQVPEGIYRILWLNPNSLYHLSLKVDYPNDFDRKMAAAEGRSNLGGDIFIHGKDVSIGCIAIGDAAIEEIFVTAAMIGTTKIKLITAPNDLRIGKPLISPINNALAWIDPLYRRINEELREYRK